MSTHSLGESFTVTDLIFLLSLSCPLQGKFLKFESVPRFKWESSHTLRKSTFVASSKKPKAPAISCPPCLVQQGAEQEKRLPLRGLQMCLALPLLPGNRWAAVSPLNAGSVLTHSLTLASGLPCPGHQYHSTVQSQSLGGDKA